MEKALTTGTMNTDIMVLPDYSGMAESTSMSTIEPERMSPMDSLKAIFEEMRDSLNTLVELAKSQQPSAADMRDQGVADADVVPDGEPDSQGNSSFPKIKMPEVGPKLGLGLMILGLSALFAYGDEIAAAIEPLLEIGANVVEKLGVKGTLFTGLGLLAAIKFGKPLLTLLGAGKKGISFAFGLLKDGFTGMKDAVTKMPGLIKDAYTGGKNLVMGAFTKLKTGFQLMRVFLLEKMIPAIASAYGGVKGKLFAVIGKLGTAFTAMRTFMTLTLIPSITAMMAPFTPVILAVTIAVAAAVAIFSSIKAGIDEFKKSLDEGDSMLVAIIEGVTTALLTLVTLPITLIKNFVAWVAKKLGFEGIAEKLKEFNIVTFIKDGVKNLVLKAKDFILGLFNLDFKQVLGKFIDIGKSIGRVLKAIALGSIAAVKAAFPGGESPMEAFKRVYDEVSNKGNENPEMPDDKDPEAMPGVKKMDDVRKEEIAANEAEIDDLQYMNPDTILEDGHSPDSKMFELEMRNEALYSMLSDKLDTSNEIAIKNAQIMMSIANSSPGPTIINTNNSTNNNPTNNTSIAGDVSIDHQDKTADALATSF